MQSLDRSAISATSLARIVSQAIPAWGEGSQERMDLVILDRWESRTATFYRCRITNVPAADIVLKVLRTGAGNNAVKALRPIFNSMEQLSRILPTESGLGCFAPQPMGYCESPPTVIMPYIDGTDLMHVLWGTDYANVDGENVESLISRCGESLGAYHTRLEVLGSESRSADTLEAFGHLRKVAGKVWSMRERSVRRLFDGLPISVSYQDFTPYNFRVATGGELALLDPPSCTSFKVVHRDISYFLFWMHRQVYFRRGEDSGRSMKNYQARLSLLSPAFLDGYAVTGPTDLRAEIDWRLLTLFIAYRATQYVKKSWARHEYRESIRYAWWAAIEGLKLRAPKRFVVGREF